MKMYAIKIAFKDDCLSCSKTVDWFKRSKDRRWSTEDGWCFGRPRTFRIDNVLAEICEKMQKGVS